MNDSVQKMYGNILRIRACGLCIENDQLLLVNHMGLTNGDFWAPPGGGMQFGEVATDCVVREFLEETGLVVEVRDFLFACEFMKEPLHALELFFLVKKVGGQLLKGIDPESGSNQIIKEVKFMDWGEIDRLNKGNLHGIFGRVEQASKIIELRGYFEIGD
jgi:8-oxo-dGTP diphosphatase